MPRKRKAPPVTKSKPIPTRARNHRTAQHPWEASREGETYEVEAIVAKRWVKGVEEFYTKWVDYPDSENT